MKNPTPANPAMTANLLFEHFATLATAPDGIARLRELILQLAVQGKLGTQDPGDEPASKLSSKILEEKKRLIKKGEISKSRALPEIESEEIPFHIPKNWVWLRLEDIGHSCGQKEPDKIFTYIDVTAINKERGLIGDEVNVLQPNEAPSRARKLVKKGTVIYSTVRPYLLNIAIVDKDFNPEPIVSTAFAVLHPFEGIFNRYLFYYLRSNPFIEYVESQMTGMAYPAINDQKFHMGLIPVPPTAEQHRIVAKVDRLMALCDELEARQQEERAGCLRLGTASLAGLQNAESPEEFGRQWAQVCDAFDLILDCPENVAVLRQMILQLAVQGKLGTQNPGDEPADVLAEKILKEKERLIAQRKIKREEKITQIKVEDIPFEIPKSWQWIKLGNICNQITDGTHVTPKYISEGIPFLSVKNFSKGFIDFSGTKFISQETHSEFIKRCKPEMNDLILTKVGTTGIAKVVDTEKEFSIFVSLALLKFSYSLIFPKYLELALNSPLGKAQSKFYTQGMGNQNLVLKSIKIFNLPLPPLAEQHRIVAKVDALMALCDALESQLNARAGVQGRVAGGVVRQVAGVV